MGTEIKTWQIVDGKLQSITTNLKDEGRTEPYDLEPWIESNASILGTDIVIIGRQTMSKSGPIDLLGIDKTGRQRSENSTHAISRHARNWRPRTRKFVS